MNLQSFQASPREITFGKLLKSKFELPHYQMANFRLFQTERVCRRQFQI